MAREMTEGMQTAVAGERGILAHLIQIEASGGTVRLATTPLPISWDGHTWEAIGGSLGFGEVVESTDLSGHGTAITLSGVDQSIIATVLTNHVRGRMAVIYLAHFDPATWQLVEDPLEIYRGFQNEPYQIDESRGTEDLQPGTVTVSTKIVSRLAELGQTRAVRSNVHSHREMLRRAGLTGDDLLDTFFRTVPELVNRPIYWGRKGSSGRGGTGSRGNEDPGGDDRITNG